MVYLCQIYILGGSIYATTRINNNERLKFNVVSAETFELLNLAVKGLTILHHHLPIRANFHSHTFHVDVNSAVYRCAHVASRCSWWSVRRSDVWRQNWQLL